MSIEYDTSMSQAQLSEQLTAEQQTCLLIVAKDRFVVRSRPALLQISAKIALEVYQQLLAITARVAAQWSGPVEVYATGDAAALDASPLAAFARQPQISGNLGQRLHAGLGVALQHSPQVMAIGTDCPGLTLAALQSTAHSLRQADICLGPSDDGGYWCLGARSQAAVQVTCAADLPWSQPQLLKLTQSRALLLGYPVI